MEEGTREGHQKVDVASGKWGSVQYHADVGRGYRGAKARSPPCPTLYETDVLYNNQSHRMAYVSRTELHLQTNTGKIHTATHKHLKSYFLSKKTSICKYLTRSDVMGDTRKPRVCL